MPMIVSISQLPVNVIKQALSPNLVLAAGIEPAITRLKVECHTTWLRQSGLSARVESNHRLSAYKADAPTTEPRAVSGYFRIYMVDCVPGMTRTSCLRLIRAPL